MAEVWYNAFLSSNDSSLETINQEIFNQGNMNFARTRCDMKKLTSALRYGVWQVEYTRIK